MTRSAMYSSSDAEVGDLVTLIGTGEIALVLASDLPEQVPYRQLFLLIRSEIDGLSEVDTMWLFEGVVYTMLKRKPCVKRVAE